MNTSWSKIQRQLPAREVDREEKMAATLQEILDPKLIQSIVNKIKYRSGKFFTGLPSEHHQLPAWEVEQECDEPFVIENSAPTSRAGS